MQKPSGKQLLLEHLKRHLGEWVHNQELRQVSGLNDAPQRKKGVTAILQSEKVMSWNFLTK